MAKKTNLFTRLGYFLFYCGFGGAAILLAWDGYKYWRWDEWQPVSVIFGLRTLYIPWGMEPASLFGLWNWLYGTPLSGALVFIGLVGIPIFLVAER